MSANESVTRLLNFETEQSAAELEKLRRNVTVLFTDLKGSTAYFEKYGDAAGMLMVHRCNTMLSQAVERHGGRVIKTIGDAVMASFEDPAEAVAASIEMQEAITADNVAKPQKERIAVRIGINYGLGLVRSNDVFGDVVNVASRVESAAAPEQILISDSMHTAVAPSGRFRLAHRGKFNLKGKSEQRDLYEVVWRPEAEAGPMHTMLVPVMPKAEPVARFRIVQVRTDGRPPREFELQGKAATIGRLQGDFTFPNDEILGSPHARVSVEGGQVFVEPMEGCLSFIRLVGSYRMQHGDVIKLGNELLEFRVDTALMQMMAQAGKGMGEIAAMLREPIAELVSLRSDRKHYTLLEQQTSFGRTRGTVTFPHDGAMSRAHARVYHRGEDFFLEDLGSTNGTFVMVREKTLIPEGSVLSAGGQLLRVVKEEGK
jgi:class 3 adenylate cyclase/pSer/pThr/pTyr-binding forkhead associated (FHA) protein